MVSFALIILMATSEGPSPPCWSRARSTVLKTPLPCVANTSYLPSMTSPTYKWSIGCHGNSVQKKRTLLMQCSLGGRASCQNAGLIRFLCREPYKAGFALYGEQGKGARQGASYQAQLTSYNYDCMVSPGKVCLLVHWACQLWHDMEALLSNN